MSDETPTYYCVLCGRFNEQLEHDCPETALQSGIGEHEQRIREIMTGCYRLVLDSAAPPGPYPFGKSVPYIPETEGITEEGFWLVPVEFEEELIFIDEYGTEGEPFNRTFQDDGTGLVTTNLVKPGLYGLVRIGDRRE